MTKTLTRILFTITATAAVLAFAAGLSALTDWLATFTAGRMVLGVVMLAVVAKIAHLAWTLGGSDDAP